MNNAVRPLLTVLLTAISAAVVAAPVGYSVNSDAPGGDTLHRIDLETGLATPVGALQVISTTTGVRSDIEGLAFDQDGVLWAIDEQEFRLFQISTESGIVRSQGDVPLDGLSDRIENDFGMTFTCDNELFISSVTSQSLYRLGLDGVATRVGMEGALGQNISALASWGQPAQLYGMGNGLDRDGARDSRSLYRIDTQTGQATLVGSLGESAGDYYQAGLSFDAAGGLWALTDRGTENSQVLRLDRNSGLATLASTASGPGFESLAVAPPAGCQAVPPVDDFHHESIPTLDRLGQLIALLALLATGLTALHRRPG